MKLLLFLIPLLVWGDSPAKGTLSVATDNKEAKGTTLQAGTPKIVAPGSVTVSMEDMNIMLKLQRDQYKAWGVLQQIDKQFSETELGKQKANWTQELEKANKEIQDKLKSLQAKYKCEGCTLGDEGKLIPQTKEVAKK